MGGDKAIGAKGTRWECLGPSPMGWSSEYTCTIPRMESSEETMISHRRYPTQETENSC